MIKSITMLLGSLLLFGTVMLRAQAGHDMPARDDRQLTALFDSLRTADGYSYHIRIQTAVNGDSGQRKTTEMVNYQSLEKQVVYSNSDEALIFFCPQGQLRVNYKERTAYYRQFYAAEGAQMAKAIMNNALLRSMDSLFLSGAVITEKKEDNARISYRLKYEPGSMMHSMELVYLKRAFFSTISYTFEQPVMAGGGAMLSQQVSMTGYERSIPPRVRELLAGARDLSAYVRQHYKDFTITKL